MPCLLLLALVLLDSSFGWQGMHAKAASHQETGLRCLLKVSILKAGNQQGKDSGLRICRAQAELFHALLPRYALALCQPGCM